MLLKRKLFWTKHLTLVTINGFIASITFMLTSTNIDHRDAVFDLIEPNNHIKISTDKSKAILVMIKKVY